MMKKYFKVAPSGVESGGEETMFLSLVPLLCAV